MNNLISCCGINCELCEARIATLNNDNELRKATAEKWRQSYDSPQITPESINCTGCRAEGIKIGHCNECKIRNCVASKGFNTCGNCPEMNTCELVAMVHKHLPEAIENLKKLN